MRWELAWRIKLVMTPSGLRNARHLVITSMENEVDYVALETSPNG